jgi:hypothetical protein
MTSSNGLGSMIWSLASMVRLVRAVVSEPLGALVVALTSEPRISSKVRPRAASLAGSTWMRIAGRCSPPSATWATPGTWESCWARKLSANSSTTVIGRVAELADRIRIGESAGLSFL